MSEVKPREFLVADFKAKGVGPTVNCVPCLDLMHAGSVEKLMFTDAFDEQFHVIEKSAFDKAVEGLKRIEDATSAMKESPRPGRPSYRDFELREIARDTLKELGVEV